MDKYQLHKLSGVLTLVSGLALFGLGLSQSEFRLMLVPGVLFLTTAILQFKASKK